MAAAKPKPTPAQQSYTVLEPLLHDGQQYKPGQPIELSPEQAQSLVSRQLISRLTETTPNEGAE